MSESDDLAAARFDADPDVTPAPGPRIRKKRQALSAHVPIRFDQNTIAAIKRIADLDRVTVSTWIRTVVEREIIRRLPDPETQGASGRITLVGAGDTEGVTSIAHAEITDQRLIGV